MNKTDGNYVTVGTQPRTPAETAIRRPLKDIETDELFEHCIGLKIGYGYYQEEKRRRTEVDHSVTEVTAFGEIIESLDREELPTHVYTTVLVGPTGIGKTSWAIKNCLKPAIICSHIEDLKKFRADIHRSIIFDDMSFKHLPLQGQIHLCDSDLARSIHVRWGIASIPAKTQKIFTCNERPFAEHPAIDRRIKYLLF